MIIRLIFALFVSLACTFVWAADPEIYSHKKKGAIKGADVVAYYSLAPNDKAVMGKDEFSLEWNGALWKFSSQENLDKFAKNPEAYIPQYGGYCAFAVGHNFTTDIRPNSWSIHEGKLYLNHNNSSRRNFLKSISSRIEKAEKNWPAVLEKCEKRNNCRKK